jgi:5-methylcytosine-specific restriction endonuclease McrA
MKYIKTYENYKDDNMMRGKEIVLLEIDFDEINKKFLEKIKNVGLEINIDNIYADAELLKKDKLNSFIYGIVKNYLESNGYQHNVHNIMYVSSNFFETKYSDVIKKYKEDKKKEFSIKNQKEGNHLLLPFRGELIKVPNRIGHNYIPLKILPLEDLHTKYSRHKRLKTFHVKGLKCVRCDRVGEYLIAAKDRGGAIHIDVYTKDFELMTVDHIKPKSLGGSYDIENLDPMCSFCNTEKSNEWIEELDSDDIIIKSRELSKKEKKELSEFIAKRKSEIIN